MEDKKYTPGPWKAHKSGLFIGYDEYEIQFLNDGECVAEVVHGEADANLIAAAPELLRALEIVRGLPHFKNFWSSTKQEIESAISKAYGR